MHRDKESLCQMRDDQLATRLVANIDGKRHPPSSEGKIGNKHSLADRSTATRVCGVAASSHLLSRRALLLLRAAGEIYIPDTVFRLAVTAEA